MRTIVIAVLLALFATQASAQGHERRYYAPRTPQTVVIHNYYGAPPSYGPGYGYAPPAPTVVEYNNPFDPLGVFAPRLRPAYYGDPYGYRPY